MSTIRMAIIRDGVGQYRRGDTVSGSDLDTFLKGNPPTESYHIVEMPAPTPKEGDAA